MNEIHCFEGKYDKALFYAKMGRFFAEERFVRQMPYLRNKWGTVWFTIERKGEVIAFASLLVKDEYVLFTTEYVEAGYRQQGLFRELTDARFEYCRELNLPIRTSTNIEFIKDYYLKRGFTVYRKTKSYWFLYQDRQEVSHESKEKRLTGRMPAGDRELPKTN
jgi:GNAT superfamily N-acetyltransferase